MLSLFDSIFIYELKANMLLDSLLPVTSAFKQVNNFFSKWGEKKSFGRRISGGG